MAACDAQEEVLSIGRQAETIMKGCVMKKNILDRSLIFWGAALISIALLAATASAAPGVKARANKTALNPVTSKPVWASSAAPRVDSITIVAMQNLRVAGGDGEPLVIVPPRPQPRSPFMPPFTSTGNLPPWAIWR